MFDVDMDKTKVILLESAFPLAWFRGNRSGSAIKSFRLQNAPDAITMEMWQKMRDDEGAVIQSEVGDPA